MSKTSAPPIKLEDWSQYQKLKSDLIKAQSKAHFGHCDKCIPVGCCDGRECGCYGMPVSYTASPWCQEDCFLKLLSDRDAQLRVAIDFFYEIMSPITLTQTSTGLDHVLKIQTRAEQVIKLINSDYRIFPKNLIGEVNNPLRR